MTTPWHIWAVGIITLIWNGFGALDYVMTQSGNAAYMAQFTPEQLAYFHGFPAWVVATWALAVWLSVLGSVLILMRRRAAAPVLGAALFFMALTSLHNFVLAEVSMAQVTGPGSIMFAALIFGVGLSLWLYARRQVQSGVLA